jgi:diguanylate cyclase
VIVTPETESGKARQLAERVRVAIESASWPNRPITGSFGIASVGLTTQSARQLIDQADAALYRSKHDGRNRITHYSDPASTAAKAA